MGMPTPAQVAHMQAHINDDRRQSYIAVNVTMLTIAVIAFVMRFISRNLGGVKLGADDWYMVVGMVSAV